MTINDDSKKERQNDSTKERLNERTKERKRDNAKERWHSALGTRHSVAGRQIPQIAREDKCYRGKITCIGDSHSYKTKSKRKKNIYHPLFVEIFFVSFFVWLTKNEGAPIGSGQEKALRVRIIKKSMSPPGLRARPCM